MRRQPRPAGGAAAPMETPEPGAPRVESPSPRAGGRCSRRPWLPSSTGQSFSERALSLSAPTNVDAQSNLANRAGGNLGRATPL
eukprot:3722941-Alexandrium_andersonii.AAC.1